jgi:hypothetical protein
MFAVQVLMRDLGMQWFHPDDETVFCRHSQQGLYVAVQGKEDANAEVMTTLQFQLFTGTPDAFSLLIRGLEAILASVRGQP